MTTQNEQPEKAADVVQEPEYKIPTLLNLSDLSKLTGFERRKISNILDEAKLHFEPGKQNAKMYEPKRALLLIYSAADIIPKAAQDQSKVELERDENIKFITAKRKKAELELQEKLALVVPIEDVAKEVSEEYEIVRSQIRNLPGRVAIKVSAMTDPEEVLDFLMENVEQILLDLSVDAKAKKAVAEVPIEQQQLNESTTLNNAKKEANVIESDDQAED